MKIFNKISAILCTAALALGVVGCTTANLDTNQYSDTAVTLASYGPNPVVRGSALRFFGSNLQNVVEVNIPGVDPITEIKVVETGKVSEIRVIVPLEGPEVGIVSLKTKDGAILKTRAELTYKESYRLESFEVKTPAYPGDVITLKGEYMQLVDHVVFAGGTEVPVEEGSTRHEAKVVIPDDAVTGKIILSDGASVETLFYSAEDLVMGKPQVERKLRASVKADDILTVNGTHLEMVKYFKFGEFVAEDFSYDAEKDQIKLVVPALAQDGVYSAVSFQGDSFEAGEVEFILPTELSAAPQPVKAGAELKITGKDLDVVSKVDFDGAADAVFNHTEEGDITVTVPATAKEGDVTLSLPNGYKSTVAFTLVHPTITNIAPMELYAGDEPVVVTGTDLDLVVSATIGPKDCPIEEQSETSLSLGTDVTSVSGVVTLTLANGEKLVSEDAVVMKYHSKVIVTERPAGQHIGEIVALKGTNMDLVESIYVGENKVTRYALRTPEEIQFIMPWAKVGSYDLKFVLFDGDEEFQAEPIEVMLEREFTTYFEGASPVAWNEVSVLSAEDVASLAIGQDLYIYYDVMNPIPDGYTQIRMIGAGWSFNPEGSPIYQFDPAGSGIQPGESGVITLTVDADLKSNYASGISLTGNGCVIKKAESVKEISQEITVFEGPCDMTWGDDGRFGLAYEYFKDLKPGAKLIFYIEHTKDWGQIQINDGWWKDSSYNFAEIGGAYIKTDIIGTATRVELTLDAENLAIAQNNVGDYAGLNAGTKYASPSGKYSFVCQGSDMRVVSIAVLP
ncbi:MAG: hypothetical protein MJY92_00230 [Bacteroidales bacterium]|nr:hypothetical protein [Bacteroidales bacterium]